MRRPLKPFVTEYKGSRRAPSPLSDPSSFETERPAPKPVEFKSRPESDDGYEAAMRAADALFAPMPNGNGNADPGTIDTPTSIESGIGERPGPERSGRVLRVIDEAPSPQLVALEAERAPKRRGRKPGSKNKPKLHEVSLAPQDIGHASIPTTLSSASRVAPAAAAPPATATQRQVVALSAAPSSRQSEKRFSWVRDRLKPGEDWKRRRLPRVCW